MATTDRGVPYPAPTAGNNVPADIQALAQWVDDHTVDVDGLPDSTDQIDPTTGRRYLPAGGGPGQVVKVDDFGEPAWGPDTDTTYAQPSQAEAEAGVSSVSRVWSALRIWQAINAYHARSTAFADAVAPFGGGVVLNKVGRLVIADIIISRAVGFSTELTVAATIPEPFRPQAAVSGPGCVLFNSAITYQYQVSPAGFVTRRQSAANSNPMVTQLTWFTA